MKLKRYPESKFMPVLPLVLLYRWFYFTVGFNQRTESKSIRGFSPIDLVAAKFIWLKKACSPTPE